MIFGNLQCDGDKIDGGIKEDTLHCYGDDSHVDK